MTTPDISTTAKQAVIDLIAKLREAGDFALAEAPEVIRQMVAYEATIAWIGVALGVVFAVVATALYLKAWALLEKADDPLDCMPIFFGAVMASFVCLPLLIANLSTAIQATFFQKWFIVSRLVEIIK